MLVINHRKIKGRLETAELLRQRKACWTQQSIVAGFTKSHGRPQAASNFKSLANVSKGQGSSRQEGYRRGCRQAACAGDQQELLRQLPRPGIQHLHRRLGKVADITRHQAQPVRQRSRGNEGVESGHRLAFGFGLCAHPGPDMRGVAGERQHALFKARFELFKLHGQAIAATGSRDELTPPTCAHCATTASRGSVRSRCRRSNSSARCGTRARGAASSR